MSIKKEYFPPFPSFLGYSPWELCKSKHFINGGIPGVNASRIAVYNKHNQKIQLVSEGNADPAKWTHISFPIKEAG